MSEIELPFLLRAAGTGIGATLVMDLWNLFLKRAFGIPSLDFCLLGRWIGHMPSGRFRHSSMASAAQKPFECPIGWSAHYTIGLVMGLVFVLSAGDWIVHPTLLPALAFGVVTVALPLFVLQPALGLGMASAKTKSPAKARLKSLATHTVFGVGLYLSAAAMGLLG